MREEKSSDNDTIWCLHLTTHICTDSNAADGQNIMRRFSCWHLTESRVYSYSHVKKNTFKIRPNENLWEKRRRATSFQRTLIFIFHLLSWCLQRINYLLCEICFQTNTRRNGRFNLWILFFYIVLISCSPLRIIEEKLAIIYWGPYMSYWFSSLIILSIGKTNSMRFFSDSETVGFTET